MPTEAFLRAAKSENRQPVLLFSVENVSALKKLVTTQADWVGSKSITNVNATYLPGDVFLVTDDPYTKIGGVYDIVPVTVNAEHHIDDGQTRDTVVRTSRVNVTAITATFEVWGFSSAHLVVTLKGRKDGGAWQTLRAEDIYPHSDTLSKSWTVAVDRGQWEVKFTWYYSGPSIISARLKWKTLGGQYTVKHLATGSLRTKTVDMGVVPTADVVFGEDESWIPTGSSLTYTARGAEDPAGPWTDLGAVTDGSLLPPYRYYDFDIAFTADASRLGSPRLGQISLVDEESAYINFSTHRGYPISSARECLLPDLGVLRSSIELMELGTISEVTPKLLINAFTSNLIATGYLRGKTVSVKLGFLGIGESDFVPYSTGVWHDYQWDAKQGRIDVKTRSILDRVRKVKLPKEVMAEDGTRTAVPIEWAGMNVVAVMLDIMDRMGWQERYIDRPAAEALFAVDGPRYGTDWDVTRTLTKDNKEEALTLLKELSVLSGVFLVQLPDGRISFRLYDPDADPVADLEARVVEFGPVKGQQADLATRQHIFYSPLEDGASSDENFAKVYILINQISEMAWGVNTEGDDTNPGYEKKWYDKWSASETALIALADRMDSWFATPKARVPASNIPTHLLDQICEGHIVTATGMSFPAPNQAYDAGKTYAVNAFLAYQGKCYRSLQPDNTGHTPDESPTWWRYLNVDLDSYGLGVTNGKKFLILSRSLDPQTLRLGYELMEI